MVMDRKKNLAHNDPRKKFPASSKSPPPQKLNGRPLTILCRTCTVFSTTEIQYTKIVNIFKPILWAFMALATIYTLYTFRIAFQTNTVHHNFCLFGYTTTQPPCTKPPNRNTLASSPAELDISGVRLQNC